MTRKNLNGAKASPVKTDGNVKLTTVKLKQAASKAVYLRMKDEGNIKLALQPVIPHVVNHRVAQTMKNGAKTNQSIILKFNDNGIDPSEGYVIEQFVQEVSDEMQIPVADYLRVNTTAEGQLVPVLMLTRYKQPYLHWLPIDGKSGKKGQSFVSQKLEQKYSKYITATK
jgi:hypothetical protein